MMSSEVIVRTGIAWLLSHIEQVCVKSNDLVSTAFLFQGCEHMSRDSFSAHDFLWLVHSCPNVTKQDPHGQLAQGEGCSDIARSESCMCIS